MITQSITLSYLLELLQGIHAAADTYKIALYTDAATLDSSTTAYSSTNEVANGNGYTTGGATLANFTASSGSGEAWVSFDDPAWVASTFTARGALIYNSSKANRSVYVIDFGSNKSVAGGTFTIDFPAAVAGTALIRLELP